MSLLSPQRLFFRDITQGMKLFLCEANSRGLHQIIDTVETSYVYPESYGNRISVKNKNNEVTEFALIDELGWVILEEDPFQSGQMTFSHRGPTFSFLTFF
jgi:hypothetical protein